MSRQFLTGAAVLSDGEFLAGHGVLLHDGIIEAVLPETEPVNANRISLPPETLLAPGLVDIQVNGGGGVLFNDAPSPEGAYAIAAAHRRLGTTSLLPTLITDRPDAMRQAAETGRRVVGPDSPILGIHFEGPFLSPDRPGVHDPTLIRPPAEADLVLLESLATTLDGRVMLTLAPEMVEDAALRRLAAAGVLLSAGHSAASFERTGEALLAGVTGFTHLFNAMPPATARAPGIVTAALLSRGWCGVILDGIHVHPAMLRLLLAAKPCNRIMLVSDAMSPTGTNAQQFLLQGRRILRSQGRLTTEDGTLAGADICLADAVRAGVRLLGLSPAAALTMASSVPAAFLRLGHHVGRIAPGCRADLVLLTPELDLLGSWLAGGWDGQAGVLANRAAA
jgi:N-acetylglucosamine-6-phosphate deacetylase